MCIGHCEKGHINRLINAVQKKEYENPQQLQEREHEEYLYGVGSVEVSDLKRIGQFKKNRRFQK